MWEYNKGVIAENQAKDILKSIFSNVTRTKYGTFYDYLVKQGNLSIRIEVKYCEIKYQSVSMVLKWKQFWRLIESKEFLIYLMTNKGNIFISPKQLFNFAHVHHYQRNFDLKTIRLRVTIKNGKLKIIEPEKCNPSLCEGTIKKWLKNY